MAVSSDVETLGALTPKPVEVDELQAGEVGFLIANIKNVADTKIGETLVGEHRRLAVPLVADDGSSSTYVDDCATARHTIRCTRLLVERCLLFPGRDHVPRQLTRSGPSPQARSRRDQRTVKSACWPAM